MSKDSEISYNVGPAQRWLLFLCVTVICYLFASVVSWVVMRNGVSPAKVYISTMVQDVMLFILPALLTALIITRRAADFLTLIQYTMMYGLNPDGSSSEEAGTTPDILSPAGEPALVTALRAIREARG